jgi:hypothetical protein
MQDRHNANHLQSSSRQWTVDQMPDTIGYRRIPPDTTGYQHDVRQKSRTSTMSDKSHANRSILHLILLFFLHLAPAEKSQITSLQIHIFSARNNILFEKNLVYANAMGTM